MRETDRERRERERERERRKVLWRLGELKKRSHRDKSKSLHRMYTSIKLLESSLMRIFQNDN